MILEAHKVSDTELEVLQIDLCQGVWRLDAVPQALQHHEQLRALQVIS